MDNSENAKKLQNILNKQQDAIQTLMIGMMHVSESITQTLAEVSAIMDKNNK